MSAALPLFLPEQHVTFIHTADWQLGMTRHFLRGDAQARYTAARQEAIGRIGRLADAHHAEFVLVCGDVFEDRQVSSRVIRRSLDHLRQVPCPVYLLPGNHDPMDAASIYNSKVFTDNKPDHVRVLDTPGPVEVRPGVSVIAAPWTSKVPLSDLVAQQLDRLAPSDDIRILAGHGRVDVFAPQSADLSLIDVDQLERAVAAGLIDYVALGDRHSTTQIGDSGRIWYSGAQEVTNYDHREAKPGQVLVVELSRAESTSDAAPTQSVTVTPHRVGEWAFRTIEHDVNGSEDITELRRRLDAVDNKSQTVVQLALRGSVTITERSALDTMVEEFTDRFAAVTWWELRHDLVIRPDGNDFAHLQLTGFIGDAADELSTAAGGDGENAIAAQEALALLFRLAGGTA
ncbi:DNA repair exonuclease SbcCD nuclease subunit [Williamsia limnetica]|uniref:Nuclease SbcCD subunit D n=1 Tax=Williamsia limnetica TaxID=882452 RepID=A0A318RER4_WILLI|nr:exonuclease SbcCD subunit D [Williamsia limnetica]PYE12622.1 DNA repair exonuclease SbcCD nuclease subunit [Williamsia limnetica]